MSIFPSRTYFTVAAALLFTLASILPAEAQKKTQSGKKTPAGKTTAKNVSKPKAKPTPSKSRQTSKKTTSTTSKSGTKSSKGNAPDKKLSAKERRRLEAERRRAEAEERRRREQAAREAAERRRQFELGLKNQAIDNILRDNLEGEDLEVRRIAAEALKGTAGTVVVMEPKTGKILSIVNQDWGVRQSFKPCSTIKLVTGIAGLNESKIAAGGIIAQRAFPMNLDDALAYSNNSYFQVVGSQMGNQRVIGYARALGLGSPTGINLSGEAPGRLPWTNSNPRIYSHGDDFEVTPLQLAVMVSAITNGGRVVTPRVVRKFEQTSFKPTIARQLDVPMNSVRGVIPGMIGAGAYGTARRNLDQTLGVAGKTGSCIGQGSWVGLFASVAPVEDPKLAVVVITRGESQRGRHAAAIAANIYKGLRGRLGVRRMSDPLVAGNVGLKPQRQVTATKAAQLDTAADDDSDDAPPVPASRKGATRAGGQTAFSPSEARKDGAGAAGSTRPRIVGRER